MIKTRKSRKIFNQFDEKEFSKFINSSYKSKNVENKEKLLFFKVSKEIQEKIKKRFISFDMDELMMNLFLILEKYRNFIKGKKNKKFKCYVNIKINYFLNEKTDELYYFLSSKQVRDFYLYTDYYKKPDEFLRKIINNFFEYGENFKEGV